MFGTEKLLLKIFSYQFLLHFCLCNVISGNNSTEVHNNATIDEDKYILWEEFFIIQDYKGKAMYFTFKFYTSDTKSAKNSVSW